MGRPLLALLVLVCVAAGAAALAPTTAVGRVELDRSPATGWAQVQSRPAKRTNNVHLIAEVRPGRELALRARPFGPVLAHVGSTTQFGSARTFGIVRTSRGRWLAVTEAGIGSNRIVWVDARARALSYTSTQLELDVDLSSRRLAVRRGSRVVREFSVGVGRPGSPTPTGRFAVTDKLSGAAYSPSYGCCILALSAIQPNLPAGWGGGNRVAIHGTLSSSDFGRAISAGCVHASDADLRYLMSTVRLGTPVVIRP